MSNRRISLNEGKETGEHILLEYINMITYYMRIATLVALYIVKFNSLTKYSCLINKILITQVWEVINIIHTSGWYQIFFSPSLVFTRFFFLFWTVGRRSSSLNLLRSGFFKYLYLATAAYSHWSSAEGLISCFIRYSRHISFTVIHRIWEL